jgi:Zn-dependent peptidase ImmA (M78 family)
MPSEIRFSIAHELGHFYLPHHREVLLSGKWHSSHCDFVSDKSLEREADTFAASLLMPHDLFVDEVSSRGGGFCTLKDLTELANNTFNTSITSTALRYAHLNFEPCCVVLSRSQEVLYSVRSEDMRDMGLQ